MTLPGAPKVPKYPNVGLRLSAAHQLRRIHQQEPQTRLLSNDNSTTLATTNSLSLYHSYSISSRIFSDARPKIAPSFGADRVCSSQSHDPSRSCLNHRETTVKEQTGRLPRSPPETACATTARECLSGCKSASKQCLHQVPPTLAVLASQGEDMAARLNMEGQHRLEPRDHRLHPPKLPSSLHRTSTKL